MKNKKNALEMKRSWGGEKIKTSGGEEEKGKEVLVLEMMSSEEEFESKNESHLC
jgi:hypothetical protein